MERKNENSLNGSGQMAKITTTLIYGKRNRKAMNRNWSNQKANPALKTKAGNK